MKIALTTQNRRSITAHAGMCRKFLVFELAGEQVLGSHLLELDASQSFHAAQTGPHPLDDIDVLISGGMGQGLHDKLARRGIRAVVTRETDPQRALEQWLAGTLEVATGALCAEHAHGHDHAHAHANDIAGDHACACHHDD